MAEAKRDYYEVLGVSRDADDATLKKSIPSACEKISSGYESRRCGSREKIQGGF